MVAFRLSRLQPLTPRYRSRNASSSSCSCCPFVVLLFGAPGSGKGTYAGLLRARLQFSHVAMGDLIRKEIQARSSLGQQIQHAHDRGELVPDEVAQLLLQQELLRLQGPLWVPRVILDGYPRTLAQVHHLDSVLQSVFGTNGHSPSSSSSHVSLAMELLLADDLIARKAAGRRLCRACPASYNVVTIDEPHRGVFMPAMPPRKPGVCDQCGGELYQRGDDQQHIVQRRLQHYHAQSRPLLDYYRSLAEKSSGQGGLQGPRWVQMDVTGSVLKCGDPFVRAVEAELNRHTGGT